MDRISFTLRMDAGERAALESLGKVEMRPVNQLINEAIKDYLNRPGPRERSLEASLASLKAYRKRDIGFQRAIAAFVEAEATLGDPLEGECTKGSEPTGPVQGRIREILSA